MPHQLSISELDPILASLEERFEETRPRPLQVIASKLLLIATFGLVGVYLLYLMGGGARIGVALGLVVLQIVLAALSWRYLPVVARQRQFYRELDLLAPEATPGSVFKLRTPKEDLLVRIAVGVALAAVVGAIAVNLQAFEARELPPLLGMLGLICATAYFACVKRKIALETAETLLTWIRFGLLVWLAVLLFLIWQELAWEDWVGTLLAVLWPAWLLVKSRQVARINDRFAPLARAGGLRETLRRQRQEASSSGSTTVDIGSRDLTQLAYAEREIIRQERVDAIGRTRTDEVERCAVYMSDRLNEQLAELEPQTRLAVHNAVSELSAIGAAADIKVGPDLFHAVEGTDQSLRYQVAADPRRVTVSELMPAEPTRDG